MKRGAITSGYSAGFDIGHDLQHIQNALLLIHVQKNGGTGFGSGFLLTSDGYAITCNHVIDSASRVRARIRIPGRLGDEDSWHNVHVVRADPKADLALLKLEGENFPVMSMAESDWTMRSGNEIVLLGYPFGAKLSDSIDQLNPSMFEGRISSKQIKNGYEQYFVDMQAKRGNSGGPVLDRKTGLVVGVLCGSQLEGDSRLIEEINYIRPVRYIWEMYVEENE